MNMEERGKEIKEGAQYSFFSYIWGFLLDYFLLRLPMTANK